MSELEQLKEAIERHRKDAARIGLHDGDNITTMNGISGTLRIGLNLSIEIPKSEFERMSGTPISQRFEFVNVPIFVHSINRSVMFFEADNHEQA